MPINFEWTSRRILHTKRKEKSSPKWKNATPLSSNNSIISRSMMKTSPCSAKSSKWSFGGIRIRCRSPRYAHLLGVHRAGHPQTVSGFLEHLKELSAIERDARRITLQFLILSLQRKELRDNQLRLLFSIFPVDSGFPILLQRLLCGLSLRGTHKEHYFAFPYFSFSDLLQ